MHMDTGTVRAAARALQTQSVMLQCVPGRLTQHSNAGAGTGPLALELPRLLGSAVSAVQLQGRVKALSLADDAAAAVFERLDEGTS